MSEDFKSEITCPYCGHEFRDSWEFADCDDEQELECGECEKKFMMIVERSISYSTTRKSCEDDKHEWDEPHALRTDQRQADQYNAEGFLRRTDHVPHVTWVRDCKNCEETEYSKDLPPGSPCPWEAKV